MPGKNTIVEPTRQSDSTAMGTSTKAVEVKLALRPPYFHMKVPMVKTGTARKSSSEIDKTSAEWRAERRRRWATRRREEEMARRREKCHRESEAEIEAMRAANALAHPCRTYDNVRIFYPTSMLKVKNVCKVCFAYFSNSVDLSDHVNEHEYLRQYFHCLLDTSTSVIRQKVIFLSEKAVQQHIERSHARNTFAALAGSFDRHAANVVNAYTEPKYLPVVDIAPPMLASLKNFIREQLQEEHNEKTIRENIRAINSGRANSASSVVEENSGSASSDDQNGQNDDQNVELFASDLTKSSNENNSVGEVPDTRSAEIKQEEEDPNELDNDSTSYDDSIPKNSEPGPGCAAESISSDKLNRGTWETHAGSLLFNIVKEEVEDPWASEN